MKSSVSSSATPTARPHPAPGTPATETGGAATATRDRFALTGPSVHLDPRTNAVRPDLADVRLAHQVFAPHYVAPLFRVLTRSAELRAGREPDTEVLAQLAAGDPFELLEVAGDLAWGRTPGPGLVGYLPADALGGA